MNTMLSRICAIYLFVFGAHAAAQSMPAPPSGWTAQAVDTAVLLRSPASSTGSQIALTLLPPFHAHGEIRTWFANQVVAIARFAGNIVTTADVTQQQGVFLRAVRIEKPDRSQVRQLFYGYPTQNGFALTILTVPAAVSEEDPQIAAANQYVQQLASQRFELRLPPAQPASVPARNAQGQYISQFGRSDTDLTYHAKSIIPKHRDVPLQGVYLFVGFEFGPSYGGVGTTMTWGQKATQQLLLLFANGVAAKTDLRGGNLAGKYQAEGFATMDVADPAAVSGAPFGHWTDDGSTIHIQWNIGAPTDLAKNGATLEGKGQRWTPFHLPDGELLEGTFVRQMEAGLPSQSIILRKDGTFVGNGVNVTMGGSIVNPYFPERGSGRYEIHKGSMILYFSNGFTQAIACILDDAHTGRVRTVLLNGFPFQRVR